MRIFKRGPKGPDIKVKTYKTIGGTLEGSMKAFAKDRAGMERDGWRVVNENVERMLAKHSVVVTYQRDH